MAGSYNKVLLMGNLTRDPEMRQLPSGNAVATIGLAVNRKFKTREGDMREEVTFVDCEAFGRTAEVMCQYLSKGRPVFVEGRLRLDQWQDKQSGENRSKLKVIIENFQFIDSRGEGGGGGGGGYASQGGYGGGGGGGQVNTRPAAPSGPPAYEPIGEDDIPF